MLSGHRKTSRKFLLYEKSVSSIRISSLTETEQQKHGVQDIISSRKGQKSKVLEGQDDSHVSVLFCTEKLRHIALNEQKFFFFLFFFQEVLLPGERAENQSQDVSVNSDRERE